MRSVVSRCEAAVATSNEASDRLPLRVRSLWQPTQVRATTVCGDEAVRPGCGSWRAAVRAVSEPSSVTAQIAATAPTRDDRFTMERSDTRAAPPQSWNEKTRGYIRRISAIQHVARCLGRAIAVRVRQRRWDRPDRSKRPRKRAPSRNFGCLRLAPLQAG